MRKRIRALRLRNLVPIRRMRIRRSAAERPSLAERVVAFRKLSSLARVDLRTGLLSARGSCPPDYPIFGSAPFVCEQFTGHVHCRGTIPQPWLDFLAETSGQANFVPRWTKPGSPGGPT